nr:RHS repeat-associated core domain-containing protein [Methanolobus psychrotolerans]
MEWYLSDHLGSTTLLVNESGLEVERTEYYPYGQVQSGGLEKYGFTGQENDADTGLMYYGARHYSPGYRVFVQPDTMLPDVYDPQALNRYAYTLNNPVKYTDPSGHYVESAIDIAFLAMDLNDIRTGNANKWTYIGLGADVVCLALPGVTGGRLGVKALEEGVTHADNVGDLFKFLDKTGGATNAGRNINRVDNTKDSFNALDWNSVVSKTGETRKDHIMLHSKDNLNKDFHGVFSDDPVKVTNEAWGNRGSITPVREGNVDKYYIPYPNAGFEGGRMGTHETLNYVQIVTKADTNQIISSYPSKIKVVQHD